MIMQHEALGQRARYERFMASMIYALAAGKKIDTARSKPFSELIDEVYANPFKNRRPEKEMSAQEIKDYIVSKLED